MKLAYITVFLAFIIGCDSAQENVVNLEGIYVREMTDEYGILHDTLDIKPAAGENRFSVVNRTANYRNGDDGKLLAPIRKEKPWTGEFDQKKSLLNILDVGDFYHFDPAKGTLDNGKVTFKKI